MTTPYKAWVTGGSGWLGRSLLGALTTGLREVPGLETTCASEVWVLVRDEADRALVQAACPSARTLLGDLRDAQSLSDFLRGARGEIVFHCAGVIHPQSVRDFERVNAQGTAALLQSALAAGVQRFVHVSSNSPLGVNRSRDHLFDERSPYDPYMGYGNHTSLKSVNPGNFQLVMQTGASGGSTQPGGQTNVVEIALPAPPTTARVDSWAAIVE